MDREYGDDPFYRVATELVALAQRKQTKVKMSYALAALLLTWNQAYYRYHPELRRRLVGDLNVVLTKHRRVLSRFHETSIRSFGADNEDAARDVFESFDALLGPVGAAKALHLLAPRFFPLWDTKIANAFGFRPRRGRSADSYLDFMELVQTQCKRLGGERAIGRNPLKALDEFNYCRYTRGWL